MDIKPSKAVQHLDAKNREAIENDEVRDAFQDAGARARDTPCLDIREKNGKRSGGPYAYLSWSEMDGDTITLEWPDREVKITGRNLATLYERILGHRVQYIQEGTSAEDDLKTSESPHIESIEVKRISEEKEEGKSHEDRRGKGFSR